MSAPVHIWSMDPFVQAVVQYRLKGWNVVPLPVKKKKSPPGRAEDAQGLGFTGREGRLVTDEDVEKWLADGGWTTADGYSIKLGNIAIRPGNIVKDVDGTECEVLGLDVDNYDGKTGGKQLLELEKAYGPLPNTWTSSARADGVSGIRWFLTPAGYEYMGKPVMPATGKGSDSIEVVQRVHRYGVCFPSMHPEGMQYRWYPRGQAPDGVHVHDGVPDIKELQRLPENWWKFLSRNGIEAVGAAAIDMQSDDKTIMEWAKKHLPEPNTQCRYVDRQAEKHLNNVENAADHHEPLVNAHWNLVRAAAEGHTGWWMAIKNVEASWHSRVLEEGVRSNASARFEIGRSRLGALRKLKGQYDEFKAKKVQFLESDDPCLTHKRPRNTNPNATPAGNTGNTGGAGGAPPPGAGMPSGPMSFGGDGLPPAGTPIDGPNKPSSIAGWLIDCWQLSGRPLMIKLGEFYQYNGTHWEQRSEPEIFRVLYSILDRCTYTKPATANNPPSTGPWDPDEPKLKKILHALRGKSPTNNDAQENSWLNGDGTLVLPVRNGLVRVSDKQLMDHTPDYFCTYVLECQYDPDATCPKTDAFVRHLASGDKPSMQLLYEWMGYVVAGDNKYQKGLIIKGRSGTGKGVYSRLLNLILGRENYAGYKVADFKGSQFAKEPLVGKSLVVFSDNRSDFTNPLFVDLVLEVIGQDATTIRMPYARKSFSVYLPCRFMILTNMMPTVGDDSGAFVRRFIVLECKGEAPKEAVADLEKVLYSELPGIVNRMLQGLASLTARAGFAQPDASAWILQAMRETSSLEHEFVTERCVQGPPSELFRCRRDALYVEYVVYCSIAQQKSLSKTQFGEALVSLGGVELHKRGTRKEGAQWYIEGLRLRSRVEERADREDDESTS